MPVLRAKTKFRYDKQKLRPGDLFKVRERHVQILLLSGMAEDVEPVAVIPESGTYSTRHMEAGPQIHPIKPISEMTVVEIRKELNDLGVELPTKRYISKAELIEILKREKA